jgi:hypothetical protein
VEPQGSDHVLSAVADANLSPSGARPHRGDTMAKSGARKKPGLK